MLDAEGGATLKTALQGILGRHPAKDDERTPAQRRADVIVELARRRLDAGDLPERGSEKSHLMLIAERPRSGWSRARAWLSSTGGRW